jgi:hypothetical protein
MSCSMCASVMTFLSTCTHTTSHHARYDKRCQKWYFRARALAGMPSMVQGARSMLEKSYCTVLVPHSAALFQVGGSSPHPHPRAEQLILCTISRGLPWGKHRSNTASSRCIACCGDVCMRARDHAFASVRVCFVGLRARACVCVDSTRRSEVGTHSHTRPNTPSPLSPLSDSFWADQ